ncbi:MAG: twin-arginine translocase TatA/TatE family subunit [Bacteroidales bacterium]|nr:twin-arginine translocase TatA/TatE family subunit [Bacteroidales bacterium]MBS3775620.1 twin-arginine translocase TatA/TatE family subunit [Bacteroidales bacterium]
MISFIDLFISGSEIFIILFAVLLLFGANKLPEIARGLGKGMNEFKKATNDIKSEFNEHTQDIQKDIKSIKSDLEESTKFDDITENYFNDDDSTGEGANDTEADTDTDTDTSTDPDTPDEDVYEEPTGPYSNKEEAGTESSGSGEESEDEDEESTRQEEDTSEGRRYPTNEDQTEEGPSKKDDYTD